MDQSPGNDQSSRQRDDSSPAESQRNRREPGLGDPYYPQAGNSGYDVTKYQIMINWDPATQSITGTTAISARATQQLNSFYVDLACTPTRSASMVCLRRPAHEASPTSTSNPRSRSPSAARSR